MAARTPFGTLEGRPISLVTLSDGAMSVELLPYGRRHPLHPRPRPGREDRGRVPGL